MKHITAGRTASETSKRGLPQAVFSHSELILTIFFLILV